MKQYYFVAPVFYLPLGFAISLVNKGYSKDEAIKMSISRFAYYGKKNNKRNKDFNKNQFIKHFNQFLNTPNAVLVRKSKYR